MSTPTKVCFIDGKISSLHSRVSGHQWKYITERRQSTSASTLTINLRVRGPCRICEKTRSHWWERYMTQKDTPSKMGFCQHRRGGDGAAGEGSGSGGNEKDSRWAVVSTAESYSLSLSTRHLENTVDSKEGIKTAILPTWAVFYCGTLICCCASDHHTEMSQI